MIRETVTNLSPEGVIGEARRFFTAGTAVSPAAIVDESPSHITVATFRSRLAIAAYPDPAGDRTRVRVSTLRRHPSVGQFLSLIRTAGETGGAAGS